MGIPRRVTIPVFPGERDMTTTLAVEDLTVSLPELLDTLTPGDEVILTRNHKPVAKLTSQQVAVIPPRAGPGLCKGMIGPIPADFDAPLAD